MKVQKLIRYLCAAMALLTLLPAAHADITIDTVTVGNPNNAADTTGYGSVSQAYNIGKYDVTLTQYTAFLNAVAQTDSHYLYNALMGTDTNVAGISRSGADGSYTYSVMGDGNRPVTYVSWFDAARFTNWLSNGQGTGSTETGAYTLNNATSGIIVKNALAQWYIPSENEWYKAAYYDPNKAGGAGYWKYATQSDTVPGNSWANRTTPNEANFYGSSFTLDGSAGYLTPVGAFTNSASAYGTYDQAGNAWNWVDAPTISNQAFRGGSWHNDNPTADVVMASSFRVGYPPTYETYNIGFRVAEAVPEPSSFVLLGLGAAGLALLRRKAVRK